MVRAQWLLGLSITTWAAWVVGLVVVPSWVGWAATDVFLSTFWIPWLVRGLTIPAVFVVTKPYSQTPPGKMIKQLVGDMFAGLMPLIGMMTSMRTWHGGVIGGGTMTVNGVTSSLPELPVGPIAPWLGWSYFLASLCWTAGIVVVGLSLR